MAELPNDSMSYFLKLPNELIDQIINETSAGDIISLVCCNKHILALARRRLAFHKSKSAELGAVVVGSLRQGPSPNYHPLGYLKHILVDDEFRFYITVMIIGTLGPETSAEDKEFFSRLLSPHEPQISALLETVRIAVLPYATETCIGRWMDGVKRGEKAAVVILLLVLYPNLAILSVQDPILCGVDVDISREKNESVGLACGTIFRSLMATAMVPDTNKLKVFSRLSRFEWLYSYGETGVKANAAIALRFMALPKMGKIMICGIVGRNVSWPHDERTSEVSYIDLDGDIDRVSLSNLIGGIKELKHFRYQFTPIGLPVRMIEHGLERLKWGPRTASDAAMKDPDQEGPAQDNEDAEVPTGDNISEDNVARPCWEPRAITAVLRQYAGSSLVYLDLTATSFKGVNRLSREEPFIGSLRSFLVLKHVRIDTMMLFERVKWPRNISATGDGSLQGIPSEEIRAQSLVKFLPKSIEYFNTTCWHIGRGFSKRDIEAMFADLPQQKHELPKFRTMFFHWASPWDSRRPSNEVEKDGWEEWDLRCQQNNIELAYREDGGHP